MLDDHVHDGDRPCAICGAATSGPDRHVRYTWPDALVSAAQAVGGIDGLWLSDESARSSVMMQAPAAGAFVRVLLPVRTGGSAIVTLRDRVGVIAVHPPVNRSHQCMRR